MIALHHGCWISEMTVNPKNWLTQGCSTKKDWYIQYYFHDPLYKNEPGLKYGKLRIIKGMNDTSNLAERRDITKAIIADELKLLLEEGYNPISKAFKLPVELVYAIEPTTPFLNALDKSFGRLKVSRGNKSSVKSALTWISKAATQLGFDKLEIQQVRRKHIKLILEQCPLNQVRWSPQSFNHYRSYLMMLFKELLELDAIELNPVNDISKMPVARKIRPTLSDEQRKQIDDYLLEHDLNLRRYVHIFFHSGSRIAELARLQGKDVDLKKQRFKINVKKGKTETETWRPIKDIALDFWKEALQDCEPDYYVFSRNIQPGPKPVWAEYVTKRWLEVIKAPEKKGGLGINIDFYSLKHLNLDETAAQLDLQAAANMAGHTTPIITMLYAQGEKDRQNERLKKVTNKFA
jgi:integrase